MMICDIEYELKNNPDMDKDVLEQNQLFLKQCKDEEKEIIKELGVETKSNSKPKSKKNKDKDDNSKKEEDDDKKNNNKKQNKKEDDKK